MSNSGGGIKSEYPVQYKSVGSYDDTVASFVDVVNNNASLSNILATCLGSSGSMIDQVGSVNGIRKTIYPAPESIDPTRVVFSGWSIYFKGIGYIKRYTDYVVNLDPDAALGAISNGIRYLYFTADKISTQVENGTDVTTVEFKYRITTSEIPTVNDNEVYIARYELFNNKIIHMIVMPDLAGTAPITRTEYMNNVVPVLNCVVSPIKGTTSIELSTAQMLLEGGNIYKESSMDPNVVTLDHIPKCKIYYCDANDSFGMNGRPEPTELIDTTKYKTTNSSGDEIISNLPSDRFAIQQVSLAPDGVLVAQYGLGSYSTLQSASDAMRTESFNFINMNKSDMYSPIFRVAYKSNTLNSADAARFKIIMVQTQGQVTAGGSAGGVFQGQLTELNNRVDVLEYRNSVIVVDKLEVVPTLRINDIVFVNKGEY